MLDPKQDQDPKLTEKYDQETKSVYEKIIPDLQHCRDINNFNIYE